MPTTPPASSTTGTRRIWCVSISSQHSFRVVSELTDTAGVDMQSIAEASAELRPAATMRVAMSRSVITPASLRDCRSSTTGISPQSLSTISRATSVSEVLGVQQAGQEVITVATVMAAHPCFAASQGATPPSTESIAQTGAVMTQCGIGRFPALQRRGQLRSGRPRHACCHGIAPAHRHLPGHAAS
jgi:hypothetical protein